MQDTFVINRIPLELAFPVIAISILIVWEIGYQIGNRFGHKAKGKPEASVGATVGVIVGLLAFLLAFTFNMASARFQERRQASVEDVNSINATYLRTTLLPEEERIATRILLREYVDLRLELGSVSDIGTRLDRSTAIQSELWKLATEAAQKAPSPMTSLFIASLNQMIDTHNKRVTVAIRNRIPDSVWIALVVLTILGIGAMSYQNGSVDQRRSPIMVVVVLMFSVVITIITDLDRPGTGATKVDQTGMTELRKSMNE